MDHSLKKSVFVVIDSFDEHVIPEKYAICYYLHVHHMYMNVTFRSRVLVIRDHIICLPLTGSPGKLLTHLKPAKTLVLWWWSLARFVLFSFKVFNMLWCK